MQARHLIAIFIMALASLGALVACDSEGSAESVTVTGPALVFFYTDN